MTTTKQKNARRMKKREKVGNGSSLVSFQKFLEQNKNLTPDFIPGVTVLSREEVANHNTPSDMWTIYRGNVYNISPFLEYHPGGEEELLKAAGTDCTELYDKYHPWVNCDAVLGPLKLGPLRGNSPTKSKSSVMIVEAVDNHSTKTPAISSPRTDRITSPSQTKIVSPTSRAQASRPISPKLSPKVLVEESPKHATAYDENKDPVSRMSPRLASKLQSPRISPKMSRTHGQKLTIKTSSDSGLASPKRLRARQVLNPQVGIFKAFSTVSRGTRN